MPNAQGYFVSIQRWSLHRHPTRLFDSIRAHNSSFRCCSRCSRGEKCGRRQLRASIAAVQTKSRRSYRLDIGLMLRSWSPSNLFDSCTITARRTLPVLVARRLVLSQLDTRRLTLINNPGRSSVAGFRGRLGVVIGLGPGWYSTKTTGVSHLRLMAQVFGCHQAEQLC